MKAAISSHFQGRQPSAIRQAQILFAQRPDKAEIQVVNLAIGNVSLPMHPAMQERMRNLGGSASPFHEGVVKYSASVGSQESQDAFLNVIASGGFPTQDLGCVVTDGGSQAMELMILGTCGPASERPLLLLDPAYTNYMDMARRCAVPTVSISRELQSDGSFALSDLKALEAAIQEHKPLALVVIPADNPTGQFLSHEALVAMGRLCVEYGMWIVSDEAYRQLNYQDVAPTSVWRLSEEEVPGIRGQRISIESASKVWNACGLRVGALVTDNPEFRAKAVAEYTANLCSNVIGQYIFGALAQTSHEELQGWYKEQRTYYSSMMREVVDGLRAALPGLIVSNPDAALYSVLDVREIAPAGFDATEFVTYCAKQGRVPLDGVDHTLLVAPMQGFYGSRTKAASTQMRLAFVDSPKAMAKVPELFAALFKAYRDS